MGRHRRRGRRRKLRSLTRAPGTGHGAGGGRAKRRVEQGGHAVLVVDSLDALPAGARRRVFGAGRNLEEGGSLTVIAVTGEDSDALRLATTRIVLEPGGPDSRAPKVESARSGTLRSDRLS